ncbi:MAG: HD-GYP domain-containing protein [Nitrospinota bacterium]
MATEIKILTERRKFKMVPKGKEMGGVAQFHRIEVALLEEGVLWFDLYLFDRERGELIPYMDTGLNFSRRMKEELLEQGIEILYVPTRDGKALDDYVESRLPRVLKSNIPSDRKLELVYNSAKSIMEETFAGYSDEKNIQRAKKIVSGIVDLFITEKEALKSIISLTIHDYYTYAHSLHVCLYGTATALRVYPRKRRDKIKRISFGLLMHDIGKTKVDPAILKKPGTLTEEEWREIRKHPWWGYRILEDMRELTPDVAKIVLHHHERVNGSGYPSGLKGFEMGMPARICAFADVFDAMTTNRPFQKGMPAYDVLTYIRDRMKCLHDQKLFEVFVKLFMDK